MVQDADNTDWWKLTPDSKGNYADGTWTQLASTTNWGPLYYASQVMPDGRVFAIGGEYNMSDTGVWTNQGGVYDPVKNTWTTLTAPKGWTEMGDTASVTLPNGLIYVLDPLSSGTTAYNPATNAFESYGSDNIVYNDEAGLTLMPNGNVFQVDCWTDKTAEVFNTTSKSWSYLPALPYSVLDIPDAEMGPAVVQYNGQILQLGGNGNNIVYDPVNNKWISAPSFPSVSSGQIDCADAPAVALPNGNVLVEAGPGYAQSGCYYYLWNGSTFTAVSGPPDASYAYDFCGNFLLLPNGQVLFADQSNDVELYTPAGKPNAAWAPTITSVSSLLKPGSSYTLSGTQLNGLTGGSAYGDDEQNETNYPIVKITSTATGNVYYAREYSPSTMAICTKSEVVSTHFTVPATVPLGAATIQVVTNGIPSAPVSVTISNSSYSIKSAVWQSAYSHSGTGAATLGTSAPFDVTFSASDTGTYGANIASGSFNADSSVKGTVTYTIEYAGATAPTYLVYKWDSQGLAYSKADSSDDAGSVGTTSTSVGIYNSACAVSSKIVSNSAATDAETYGSLTTWVQGENPGGSTSSPKWTGSPGNWTTTITIPYSGISQSVSIARKAGKNAAIGDSYAATQKLVARLTQVNGVTLSANLVNGK
jgi:hypothetical protein